MLKMIWEQVEVRSGVPPLEKQFVCVGTGWWGKSFIFDMMRSIELWPRSIEDIELIEDTGGGGYGDGEPGEEGTGGGSYGDGEDIYIERDEEKVPPFVAKQDSVKEEEEEEDEGTGAMDSLG